MDSPSCYTAPAPPTAIQSYLTQSLTVRLQCPKGTPMSWALRLGHRALSVGAMYTFGCSVVWQLDLYLHTNFNLSRATDLAEWPQLLSA